MIEKELTTHSFEFTSKMDSLGELDKSTNLLVKWEFSSITIEPKFAPHSREMLKILDMLAV